MMFTTKKYLLLAGAVPVGNAESLADLFKSLEDYAKDASTLRNDKTLKKAFTNLQETVDAAVDVAQTTSDVADSAAVFAVELANGAREFANTADDVANEAARASVTLDAIANGMKQAQDTANAIFDFFFRLLQRKQWFRKRVRPRVDERNHCLDEYGRRGPRRRHTRFGWRGSLGQC